MSFKLNIEPRVRSLVSYLSDIENGIVQIPSFQRDYVWNRDDIKDLFDSIKNRYPIGSVLFWKPEVVIGANKDRIGSYYVPQIGKETIYILDGYQRLSTLFGCLTNPHKTRLTKDSREWESLFKLYYDLEEENFIYIRPKAQNQPYQIPVYILMNSSDFRQYARKQFELIIDEDKIEKYYDRADKLSRVFLDYQIASIDINNANIEEAVEIFSRVNSKGQEISFDWMANALSIKDDFRFGDEIDNLLIDLKELNFDKIDRNVIFRCIQSSFGKLYIDNQKIEVLAKRDDFGEVTKYTLPKIKMAVKFLVEELLVVEPRLIPYNIQLIFIVDFFKRIDDPTDEQKQRLKDWFWITTYSNYFTIYSLASQRRAYEHFQEFLAGNKLDPVYNDNPSLRFVVGEFPDKISMGSVRAKALTLFLLNYSNGFRTIDSGEAQSFKLQKIFANSNESTNFIPVIDDMTLKEFFPLKKSKDLSYLLTKVPLLDLSNFFISKDMQIDLDLLGDASYLLIQRRNMIMENERAFVEDLNMEYGDLPF